MAESNKPLVIPLVLKGDNYLLWARTAKTNLGSKGLWRHVKPKKGMEPKKGVEPRGEMEDSDDEDLTPEEEKWKQEDQVVLAAIQNSLEHSILQAYSYCSTAQELWDTLKGVYGDVSNLTRVFEVKKALTTLTQDGAEFKAHFGRYRSLLAELDMLRPSTMDPKVIRERKEQDNVFGLLMTLDPCYNDLVKHILRGETLPNLESVCSQIQKEKGSLVMFDRDALPTAHKVEAMKVETTKTEAPMANKADYKRNNNYDRKPFDGICDHCKRPGHKKAQCYSLHPHLRPSYDSNRNNNYRNNNQGGPRSNYASGEPSNGSAQKEENRGEMVMKKSDVEALILAMATKLNSGISLFSKIPNDNLIVDSGASHHMVKNASLLSNIKPTYGNVTIANGDQIPIKGIGCLDIFDKKSDAFYMPSFNSNLLSVKRATKDLNCYAIFGPNDVKFQDIESGKLLGKGGTEDELYVLKDLSRASTNLNSSSSSALLVNSPNAIALNVLWHARLGHPHARALELLIPNISFDNSRCEACILGKHCKVVFPNSKTIYESCFDLIHSDVWTAPCTSRDQNKYFVTFIDEKSKYTWITLLPSKDRVFDAFQNFLNYVTNQYNAKVKVLRSDNGGEYTSQQFKAFLAKHGIVHQTSCPYTPQQNGVAERKNRHLMEVARSMMFHHNVPKRFWGDAVMASCYLINRIPTKILQDKSPFEVLNKIKPSLDHLRVFGCVCFVLVPGGPKTKLDARSIRSIFLGYSTVQKGYKCFDPTTNKTFMSRDVRFFEEQGYYVDRDWESLKDLPSSNSDRAASLRFILEHLGNSGPSPAQPTTLPTPGESRETSEGTDARDGSENGEGGTSPEVVVSSSSSGHTDGPDGLRLSDENRENDQGPERETSSSNVQDQPHQGLGDGLEIENPRDGDNQPLRRSSRIKSKPDTWVNKRVYYNANAVAHPTQAVCSLALIPQEHQAYMTQVEAHKIPQTYEEAVEYEVWVNAVDDEVGAMVKNHTWEEAELPPGKRCVSSRWVFTIKYKSNGEIERYKARLVARGFTQKYGDDYTDTFAPVAKQHTVKVVLSLAVNLDWELWQMDVKNAFLQGDLEEEVYMTPPPGLEASVGKGKVLRLKKAIYGLKQSPRAWYYKLSSTLKEFGFRKCQSDHTLFTLQNADGIVVVLVYVDDIIISGNNSEGIKNLKTSLHHAFDIKDLGVLKYFLGIEVCRSPEGLFLSQRKYTLDLLESSGKLGCKPAKTPLEAGYKVNRKGEQDDTPFKDVAQYRRMVGKLIYLTYTRPDISYAVNQVSIHMSEPTVYHWSMIDRILRYLKGTSGLGVWMGRNDNTEIVGYCDADWAGDRNDRKSTTGYCTFIGGNLVTWKTKKQKVVSESSAEAEYRAMRKLVSELTWLKAVLKELGIEDKGPITMHCDNQAAIHIATNSVFHERTKHIEIDCHKVREKIEEGLVLPCFTRSQDQLADIFTKAASLQVCNHIHSKLGLKDLTRH